VRVVEPPTDSELRALVDACRATLLGNTNELVKVAAAVLDHQGRTFSAVHVRSRNCSHCSVCAEAIAIGMALTAGSNDLVACVSLVRCDDTTRIWSPCGTCRELLNDHEVRYVLVEDDRGQTVVASSTDLLPWPGSPS
jgi:cytidine deaminase